jgi:hypothetical protein
MQRTARPLCYGVEIWDRYPSLVQAEQRIRHPFPRASKSDDHQCLTFLSILFTSVLMILPVDYPTPTLKHCLAQRNCSSYSSWSPLPSSTPCSKITKPQGPLAGLITEDARGKANRSFNQSRLPKVPWKTVLGKTGGIGRTGPDSK